MFNKITCKLNWKCDKEIDCKDCDLLHRENLDEIEARELDPAEIERAVDNIQDSGNRTHFESGAVRDIHEGKGRMDLLPASSMIRLSKHFENGAKKYDQRNWEIGIPVHSFIDSALRHLMNYLEGKTDEDHLCAATWNCMCAMWTEDNKPELQDIPARMSAKDGM